MNMRIKKFNEMKSGDLYDYGCVMINLDFPNWEKLISKINPKDIYLPEDPTHGIESNPHVTILYGLHSDVTEEEVIRSIQNKGISNINLEVNGIDIFQNKDFDVIKMNVKSDTLNTLNKELSKLPHTSDYPDYKPHITIGYVKPGLGIKYRQPDYKYSFNNIKNIVYTKTDGEIIYIQLK